MGWGVSLDGVDINILLKFGSKVVKKYGILIT
jgi:hypothetical protein